MIKLTCLLFKLFSVNLRPNTNRYWVIFVIENKGFCVMVEYHSLSQVNFFHGKSLAKNHPTRCGFNTSSMSYLVSHHVTYSDMAQKTWKAKLGFVEWNIGNRKITENWFLAYSTSTLKLILNMNEVLYFSSPLRHVKASLKGAHFKKETLNPFLSKMFPIDE